MVSMTGYGFSEFSNENFQLSVELKSYNNRYLELYYTTAPIFSLYENEISTLIKQKVKRGKIETYIRFKNLTSDVKLVVDQALLDEYKKAFEKIKSVTNLKVEPSISDYLNQEGLINTLYNSDPSIYKEQLLDSLNEALTQLVEMREKEGEATKQNLKFLIKEFSSNLDIINSYAGSLETKLKDQLLERFDQLLGNRGYDESRFLQEVAILLVKYSINEELERLKAHIVEFNKLVELKEAVGKRIDFLTQEMNREINTIGSKSIIVEVNQTVVKMKESLENIREQIRNVE
ncbi:MAG: YicC/YloC family endoribonuclease [Sphaerochaetaceae bacterium]|jgi:uncharacterized protein (TIGR00255 family)